MREWLRCRRGLATLQFQLTARRYIPSRLSRRDVFSQRREVASLARGLAGKIYATTPTWPPIAKLLCMSGAKTNPWIPPITRARIGSRGSGAKLISRTHYMGARLVFRELVRTGQLLGIPPEIPRAAIESVILEQLSISGFYHCRINYLIYFSVTSVDYKKILCRSDLWKETK